MLLLVGKSPHALRRHLPNPLLGSFVGPRSWWTPGGLPWAADNDAFNGFDPGRFTAMLDRLHGIDGCLFVACPDVVGDARATLILYDEWALEVHGRGYPVGFVAQDGADRRTIDWDGIDALFVGGTTEFKMGPDAARLVLEAKNRGKWVHMGRVNGGRRIRYAASLGVDSVDGTGTVRFTDRDVPLLLRYCAAPTQGNLLRTTGEAPDRPQGPFLP